MKMKRVRGTSQYSHIFYPPNVILKEHGGVDKKGKSYFATFYPPNATFKGHGGVDKKGMRHSSRGNLANTLQSIQFG